MRKETTIALAVLCIISTTVIPAFASGPNDIVVTYHFSEPDILGWLDTGNPIQGLETRATEGKPLVPYKIGSILLPPYTEVGQVQVTVETGGQHAFNDIACGQPPCIIGEEPSTAEDDPSIYGSDAAFPSAILEVGTVSSLYGYNILQIQLYPIQYHLVSKTATYSTQLTVVVTAQEGGTMDIFRGLQSDRETVENSVDNPWTVSTYDYVMGTMGTFSTVYQYLIITTVPLLDEFQVLANWKARWVNGVRVETVSAGTSAQEIKNIINDYYTYYGTDYVLLGGDVGTIAYHTKTVTAGWYTDDIAEDYWFGNLVGGDDISEYEVYVGRAPVDNDAEAQQFVRKVISYEQMSKPTANLFHQSRVGYNNNPDSRQLAWQCEQYVPQGYTNYELFEENGRIDKPAWVNFWRNNGILCEHIGHGSPNSYYINYQVGGGSVTWLDTDLPMMDNTFWPVHTSVACHSGEFTANECLAEAYVKDDRGAIACFMNDKYGWYKYGDATYFSGDFIEMQFHSLYQEGYQNIGAILAHSKYHFIDEATNPSSDRPYWEWCWREINLIGDPETPVLTKRSSPPATPSTPSGPTTGYVYTNYAYTTSTTDPEGDNVYYEFSWGDGTYTTVGPYSSGTIATASHQWKRPVTYQIKARAKDAYDAWSGWSETTSVTLGQNDANSGGDAGNTYELAYQISSGSYKGTLYPSNPIDTLDWYRFYADNGQHMHLSMTPPTGVDFDLQLYDPNGNLRATSKNGPGVTDTIYFYADITGYWRILIYHYSGEGQCTFSVSVHWHGGGGCPYLYVYDGNEYFNEGLLDIHNADGVDVLNDHTLISSPKRTNGLYAFRLVEHPQTISHIDQVKLYAILEDKTLLRLPLIWAWHSEEGLVLRELLFSDDSKIDCFGADHNDGVSQSIELRFIALPPGIKTVGFVFTIEGNNQIIKQME